MGKYKSYGKPYRVKRRKLKISLRFFWLGISILIILGGIFYLIFFFPKFQIKEIKILTDEKVSQKISIEDFQKFLEEKITRKFFIFSSKSIFLFRQGQLDLATTIWPSFPKIGEIKCSKKFPDTLVITIKNREAEAIWCEWQELEENEKCYFVDKYGINFESTFQIASGDLKITDEQKKVEEIGIVVIPEERLKLILEIREKLKKNLHIESNEFIISSEEKLNVKTATSWQIYFNPKEDISDQLSNLDLVLKEKIPLEKRGELEYIDLRFGNRVYFKYKGE